MKQLIFLMIILYHVSVPSVLIANTYVVIFWNFLYHIIVPAI